MKSKANRIKLEITSQIENLLSEAARRLGKKRTRAFDKQTMEAALIRHLP